MKKQILTLAFCIAVTSAAAISASCASTSPSAAKNPPCAKPCNQSVTPSSPCDAKKASPEEMKAKFKARMDEERYKMYSEIGLSAAQIKKAEALHKKTFESAEPLMTDVRFQRAQLLELKAKKATEEEISKQKTILKASKKKLRAHMKASEKEFESILDKTQLAKFKELKETHRQERKKYMKEHEGFKGGEFGEGKPGPMPCPVKQGPCKK